MACTPEPGSQRPVNTAFAVVQGGQPGCENRMIFLPIAAIGANPWASVKVAQKLLSSQSSCASLLCVGEVFISEDVRSGQDQAVAHLIAAIAAGGERSQRAQDQHV